MNARLALVIAVGWALACASGPVRAGAQVKLIGGDETRTTEVLEDLERGGATVDARHDGTDWVLTLTVEGPDEAAALALCDQTLALARKEQKEAHRKAAAAQRGALADQMAEATPAEQNELRRKMEDLAASLERDDLEVVSPCARQP